MFSKINNIKGNKSTKTRQYAHASKAHTTARVLGDKSTHGHMRAQRVLRRGTRFSRLCKTVRNEFILYIKSKIKQQHKKLIN